jgi:hypothetical protein
MALADAPDLARAREAWKQAEEEEAYWSTHWPELLNKHADQFVAISPAPEPRIIAASPDLQQLIQTLVADGVDPQNVWIRFVTKDPHRLLL